MDGQREIQAQSMEFPNEIWSEIMGYFHSAYKKPLHYVCLLENNQFYFARETNKTLSRVSNRFRSRFNLEMDKVYNSFYMTIILYSGNTTIKNPAKIRLNRHTAHPDIVDDFNFIFHEYRNQNLQILNNVKYL